MGATAGFVIASVVGAVASQALAPKPKAPNLMIEAPPVEAAPQASAAAAGAKKRIAGAQGIQDTLLTGPKGLGEIAKANAPAKTLLGY